VKFAGDGYLRALDEEALADWAASGGVMLRLRVRPGDYLFPGATVAEVETGDAQFRRPEGRLSATEAFAEAALIGNRQAAVQDLEFAVRQLVEVAVRALSPGINDPFTAMAVLDRLGATLCAAACRPGGASAPGDRLLRALRRHVPHDPPEQWRVGRRSHPPD
jgi:uncharacterized membrane protein